MNIYSKFVPNVWLAKCEEQHEKGDIIQVTTRYGKENDHEIHNLIKKDDEFFYYSVTRCDGLNAQTYAQKKANKYIERSEKAEAKSNDYYEKSNQHKDFLSLAEPIKIGHHSERGHRRIIDQAHNNMSKCVEESKKAEDLEYKAKYWQNRTGKINLSMPDSVKYYEYLLGKYTELHQSYKDGTREKDHSLSMSYAKKDVNETKKKLELAKRLWA